MKKTQDYHGKTFADSKDLVDLKKRFDIFSNVETIGLLKTVYLPKMAKFGDDIDKFLADNEQIRQIVR